MLHGACYELSLKTPRPHNANMVFISAVKATQKTQVHRVLAHPRHPIIQRTFSRKRMLRLVFQGYFNVK